jgi:hypothetical protein
MIELRYNLNTKLNSSRPIITLTINRHEFRCLFDTGAEVPVFCVGEQIFLDTFKDAKCFKNSSISGFGKIQKNLSFTIFQYSAYLIALAIVLHMKNLKLM